MTFADIWKFLKLCWWFRWTEPRLWRATENAVHMVMEDRLLNQASKSEPMLRFCPRCGQRPDGDRRMEEARAVVMAVLKESAPPRRYVDLALALHYWWARL